ncbi:hypothetical protein L3V83_13520 [Thiotrichales bacterium 19X7-9]|nr:hypothetical protein [Thiotrichales bacterium 19X7-9]
MYKKIKNAISSIRPDYDSIFEVIYVKPIQDDFLIFYRMHGKSGIDKIKLTHLINDDALLNNFSGATVRNLTACALKISGASFCSVQSTSMECNSDSVSISLSVKSNNKYNKVDISDVMSDSKKMENLSKAEIARLYYLSGYKEGYEDHVLEQSLLSEKRESKCKQ